jgi:crotonobetainyl-CoA:carnitine CoA-transferase CaiB-like acyl-CoA transferase
MWIDISLINIALSVQSSGFASYLIDGELPKRSGNQNPAWSPGGAFRTQDDKYVSVVVLRESHWEKFCQAIGRPELREEEKFKNNSSRIENRAALNEVLKPIFRGKKKEEWIRIFKAADVLCAPVNTFADIMDDAALCQSLSLLNFNLMGRPVRTLGNPIEIDGEYPAMEIAACRKGENTVDILHQLGFGDAEIQDLLAKEIAHRV